MSIAPSVKTLLSLGIAGDSEHNMDANNISDCLQTAADLFD